MNYTEFKDALVSKVKEQLDASCFVTLETITKNNGISLDAIVIRNNSCNVSPSLYINHLFGAYENGESLDDISAHLIELYKTYQVQSDFDTDSLFDYEKSREQIIYKLINYEKNESLLSNVPYIEFLDLAVVFYYKVSDSFINDGYVLINNELMTKWKITKEDLYSTAKENTERIYKVKVTKVFDLVYDKLSDEEKEIFALNDDFPLFVLSNEQIHNGANCLLDNETLSSLCELHDSNLYILPSSIHETLFIPEKENPVDLEYLIDLVKCVNTYELPEQEYLSNHVYFFSREDKKLSIAG